MKDQLIKALALDGRVRFYLDRTTDLVQEAAERFNTTPTATAALGRVLSIASIMGSMLKDEKEMLTINIMGNGPIGSIIVDAYPDGTVRGFAANPYVDVPFREDGHLNVGAAVGNIGTLTVTKDLSMEDNFSGTVELQTGEIGEDFAYYFTLSEQTPTAVSVGVKVNPDGSVKAAGCLVLQMMPDATEDDIQFCEHILSGLKPMSELIEHYDDVSLEQLALDLFPDAKVLSAQPIKFECKCSKERSRKVLAMVSRDELTQMIEEDGKAEVICEFCNERYSFNKEELQQILDESEKNLEEMKELESAVHED